MSRIKASFKELKRKSNIKSMIFISLDAENAVKISHSPAPYGNIMNVSKSDTRHVQIVVIDRKKIVI